MVTNRSVTRGTIMNRIKAVLALAAVLAGAAASAPAFAGGHTRFSFGLVIGAPFYPWYTPPYYYYPPAVVAVPAAPTTYIEQAGAPAPSQRSSYWYYCEASRTYYPYVKECPAGWLRVVPQAAPQTPKTPQAMPQTAER
jgi:hypothetical protein